MKIAFIGSRGIPARYSGFETFYEQLGTRLSERGHKVTVYNRSNFIKDVKGSYNGVRIVSLPSIQTKHLDTISHTFLSSVHAAFQGYDIIYYCIVGNSPLVCIPKVNKAKTLLSVDGEDWARQKWSGFARWYQRKCESLACTTADVLIADAKIVQSRYKSLYNVQPIFVPYGGNVQHDDGLETLQKWDLQPEEYIVYVGRFVPENAIHLLIEAFKNVQTDKKLVIIGDAPYADSYREQLHEMADERVVFTGYAFGKDYAQLSSHAYCYVQPSGIDGTRPAILDQIGFGNCVLVRNSAANSEVVADCGCYFDKSRCVESMTEMIQKLIDSPGLVASYRRKVTNRLRNYYNWEWITSFYEDMFKRLVSDDSLISYDEYLQQCNAADN